MQRLSKEHFKIRNIHLAVTRKMQLKVQGRNSE